MCKIFQRWKIGDDRSSNIRNHTFQEIEQSWGNYSNVSLPNTAVCAAILLEPAVLLLYIQSRSEAKDLLLLMFNIQSFSKENKTSYLLSQPQHPHWGTKWNHEKPQGTFTQSQDKNLGHHECKVECYHLTTLLSTSHGNYNELSWLLSSFTT